MAIETFLELYRKSGHDVPPVPARKAMGGAPFEAAGRGRRGQAWHPTRLGLNTLLYADALELVARNRDAVRNNQWAGKAVTAYVSNAISTGITMTCQHPDPRIKEQIQTKWDRWVQECDSEYLPRIPGSARLNLYGEQKVGLREIFEAGEVFLRFLVRDASDGLSIPLQVQLMESEQLPTYRMAADGIPPGNIVRSGIEWDKKGRRAAYHFYLQHPGETLFWPQAGMKVERVPAEDVLHVFDPIRAAQMRGQPWLTSCLVLLYELDKFVDAEILRKQVATMFAAFITKPAPDGSVLPPDPATTATAKDAGVENVKLQAGTMQELYPGEGITFPDVPDGGNFDVFLCVMLHAFAAGAGGLTYEQITGDLKGVSYSSIRSGLLEMRRVVEQFQYTCFIHQFCQPIYARFLREAVLCGALRLPGYAKDARDYELTAKWVAPGWDWVDPLKDIQAEILAIRAGLTSRTHSVAETGRAAEKVDAEQKADHDREKQMDLVYESNPANILTRGETEDDPSAPKVTSKKAKIPPDKGAWQSRLLAMATDELDEEQLREKAAELGFALVRQ